MTSEAIPNYCAGDNMLSSEDEPLLKDYSLARYLAINLVGQILQEAFVAVNTGKESGDAELTVMSFPRQYTEAHIKENDALESDENNVNTIAESLDDSIIVEKIDAEGELVTSTPQKLVDETLKPKIEVTLIGQGDQEMQHSDMTHNNSTLINQLFDMHEHFEDIVIQNEDQEANEPSEVINDAMTKIVDSYFNSACNLAVVPENTSFINTFNNMMESKVNEYSDYAFLADVFGADIHKNVAFYIDDEIIVTQCAEIKSENEPVSVTPTIEDTSELLQGEPIIQKLTAEEDVLNIMNSNVDAYLTLNRDEEQFSDEDGVQLLNDPKNFSGMQEVDLMSSPAPEPVTASIASFVEEETPPSNDELVSTSVVAASNTSKKSLAQRCRVHGSRLLACLRGWWRRRTPSGRKVSRVPGISRGYLSPDCRRRGLSLDNRETRDSSLSEPVVWKFNTVNEALVNSSKWKDYTFEEKPGECGEAQNGDVIT